MEALLKRYSGTVRCIDNTVHCSEALLTDPNGGELIFAVKASGKSLAWHSAPEFDELYRRNTAERVQDNALQRYVVTLFREAYERKAQDIHVIQTGTSTEIRLRIFGDMVPYDRTEASFGWQLMALLYNYFAQQTDAPVFSRLQRVDGRIVNPAILPKGILAVRLHAEPMQSQAREGGAFMTLRLLYDATTASGTLEERLSALGLLPAQIADIRLLTQGEGLSVISGPTGHGKSTLLKHIFESMVLASPERSYMSVEDPPEYLMNGVQQIQVLTHGSEVTPSLRAMRYQEAIAGALRSDPDVLLVGEIRYAEACAAAITCAQTGHAVWSTLHANDVFGIVRRLEGLLTEVGIPKPLERITDPLVLAGLVHQRLVPVLCPHCKIPLDQAAVAESLLADIVRVLKDPAKVCVRGPGCEHCGGRGTIGMTICAEVVRLTEPLLRALSAGKIREARQDWLDAGGMSCLASALWKCADGQISPLDLERRLGIRLADACINSVRR